MVKIIRPNKGEITFVRGVRPATNEERYEGLMRGSLVGPKSYTKEMIICSSLVKRENIEWLK